MTVALPALVHELLASRIDSFEKLEIVVALAGSARASLSIDELTRAVQLPRDEVRQVARELRAASLVEVTSSGEVHLLPPTDSDHAAVTELVRLYKEDRFGVVKAMGEISLARIRSLASRAFADAFVIGRKPKKDNEDG